MSEELELQDSQEPDIDLEQEESQDTSTDEDVESLKAKLEATEAKNRQLYARLKKDEQPKESVKSETTDDFSDIRSTVQKLSLSEQKRQFGYENNLSPEETDAVFRLNPKPDKKTLEDPFVKGGLEAIRPKRRVEGATPSSTGKASTVNGKTFAEMNADERKANFEKIVSRSKK